MNILNKILQPKPSNLWKAWAVCLGIIFLGTACRKGELNPGEYPDTKIFLDQIQLPDSLRLSTVVQLHWTGFVQNAYIAGYEISTNGGANWGFTNDSDSTFVFTVPPGNQNADISFWVRAIDNYGRKDPSPAQLVVPVKNTPPVIALSDSLADTVLTVFSLSWNLTDLDGEETLDSIQVRMNNADWISLPPQTNLVTFVPNNPTTSGAGTLKMFRGTQGQLLNDALPGAILEGMNQFSVRGKDKSGAFSNEVQTSPFYLKKINSDLLVIDAYPADPVARSLYAASLNSVYPNYDFVSLLDNNRKYQPKYWNIAFKEWIALYDKVFWYSSRSAYNLEGSAESGLLLETSAQAFQSYLNAGGKLLILSSLPAIDTNYNFVPTSPVFTLLPIDTLSTSVGQARLQTDSLVMPALGLSYPALTPSQFLTGLSPFHPRLGSEVLYSAQITPNQGWIGPRVVGARQRGNNGKVQLIFFSLDMHYLNSSGTVPGFLQEALTVDFNW
jgi:hypothetical protein